MTTRFGVLLLAVSSLMAGADRDFDRLVHAVESRLGIRQTHIPLMGVANFFVKVARPEGVGSFHLAVFEDLKVSPDDQGDTLDRIMKDASGGLHPLVVVRSRRDHERTYIYAGDLGKTTRMLIAAFERNEATIVEVEVGMDTLVKALADPRRTGNALGTR